MSLPTMERVLDALNEADALLVVLRLAWDSPHRVESSDADMVVSVALDRIRCAMNEVDAIRTANAEV